MWAYRTEHNTSHPGRCLAFGCISKNKLAVNANLSIYSFESSFLDVMGSSKQTRKKKSDMYSTGKNVFHSVDMAHYLL